MPVRGSAKYRNRARPVAQIEVRVKIDALNAMSEFDARDRDRRIEAFH
jgi:hypothetical protein